MKVCYVKETEKQNSIIDRIKNIFCIIRVENKDNKLIYNLPIFVKNKISKRKVKKISKKTINLLYKNKIKNVVLSDFLERIDLLKENLYSEKINILNGKILYAYMLPEIIEYILKQRNKKIEERRNNYISK